MRTSNLSSVLTCLVFWPMLATGDPAQPRNATDKLLEEEQVTINMDTSIGDDSARREGWENTKAKEALTTATEATSNEDPDAARRAKREIEREREKQESTAARPSSPDSVPADSPVTETTTTKDTNQKQVTFNAYGSVRLHIIQYFDAESDNTSVDLGDGASRAGISGTWQVTDNWDLFGRFETGFDIIDTFTAKAQFDGDGKINDRLAYIGLESDALYLKLGKSYSAYYAVAGDTDRFSIFGGNASGVYNAGTDGGATGTGRADQALQSRLYLDPKGLLTIKPFNINLQYQAGQAIPHVSGEDYSDSWSASAWLENDWEVGIGLAYHRARLENPHSAAVEEAGITGDAVATALALRTYGDRWLISLVFNKQENIETTNEQKYIDGSGTELFMQWQFIDNFWLIGGGNWLTPDEDDPDAGDYIVKYGVLGMRYTLGSFRRMVYFEWRDDHGSLANGVKRDSEFTIGFRWDIGY